MTNQEAHKVLNEMMYVLAKKQNEQPTDKRKAQIEALKEGCKAIRERDQMNLFK